MSTYKSFIQFERPSEKKCFYAKSDNNVCLSSHHTNFWQGLNQAEGTLFRDLRDDSNKKENAIVT